MRKVLALLICIISIFGAGCSLNDSSDVNSNISSETENESSSGNEEGNESGEDGSEETLSPSTGKEYWTGIH